MLWNVDHLWNRGSRFAFNRYGHWGICIVQDRPGKPLTTDRTTLQGGYQTRRLLCNEPLWSCTLAASKQDAGGASFCPSGAAGEASANAGCLDFLYGYFAEPEKSCYICKVEDEKIARREFEMLGLNINFSWGERYLGGYIGSGATKDKWIGDMVAKWVAAVETLAKVAVKYPQTAYAGFTFCLQNEWQYLQHVVADTGPFFEPLEKAIQCHFLPALLGLGAGDIDGKYRELLMHSVTKGGLASLVDDSVKFDIGSHLATAKAAGQAASGQWSGCP
ncbi:LOW QUALITY PROTEIN: hypothetical protein ACHAWU_009969 [Discostella pseudostelligera]|uniref:Uncharacterized protein n=1 Tax=Discostella pseudostelligera TaxID=259834 RepID=A0ABD3MNN0_9STRA